MTFLLSLFMAAAFALSLNALFGFSGRVSAWLRLFLLLWIHIVLSAQISGGLSILTPFYFTFVQFLLLLAALAGYKIRKMPSLLFPYTGGGKWFPSAPIGRTAVLLGIAAALVYVSNLILSLFVPQNNYDSLTYHLARVGFWIQHHSLAFWDTPNFRQTSFPPNAELGILWGMLLSGSERFAGLVQWSAALACMAAIFGIARLLRAAPSQAALAALVWACLPQVVLQSATTQNDLVIAAFIACGVFFLQSGLQRRRLVDLAFSGAAIGLALGTKTTVFFALPGIGIAALLWLLPNRRKIGASLAAWIGFCLGGLVLLGGMVYAQNWQAYRNPLGPGAEGEGSRPVSSRLEMLGQNSLFYAYQSLDFSGLPSAAAAKLVDLKARLAAKILGKLNWTPSAGVYSIQQILTLPARAHEDLAWFGPVLWLGFLPAWIAALWKGLTQRRPDLLAYAAMAVLFCAAVSYLISWTPFKSRYFIPCTVLAAPLFTLIDRPRLRPYTLGLALLAALVAVNTTLINESRPLIGANAIWGKAPIALRTMNMPQMEMVAETVAAAVPLESRLALHLGANGADALFFGPGLKRELVQVDPIVQRAGVAGLKAVQADFLLVGPREQFFFTPPPGMEMVSQVNNAALYRVDNALLGTESPKRAEPFPESDPQRLVFTASEFNLDVAVMEVWTGSWGIEQLDGDGFYWFGQGEPQGLGMKLWSEVDAPAVLRLRIEPGPSRADRTRTIAVVPSINGVRQAGRYYSFSAPTDLLVPIELIRGINEIGFAIQEPADGTALPNGDPRALLARLNRITIEPRP